MTTDDDHTHGDDEAPPTPEEKRQAEALARALAEGDLGLVDEGDRSAIGLLSTLGKSKEMPLGELRARGIAREALRSQAPKIERGGRGRGRRIALGAMGFAAAAAVMIALSLRTLSPTVPERLCSRSAGALVPGPFPASQTAAERLDVVAADRLVAYRELRLRGLSQR